MRIPTAILAVLAFVAAPMAAEAYVISAGSFSNLDPVDSVSYAPGKSAHFSQADGTTDVIVTNQNSDLGGTYSGGLEFGVSSSVITFPDPPAASIWANLELTLDIPNDGPTLSAVLSHTPLAERKQILRVDFDDLVDNVSVTFSVPTLGSPDNTTVFGFYAFDALGNTLGRVRVFSNDLPVPSLTQTLSLGSFGIKTLLIGNDEDSDETVGIVSLSFDINDAPPPVVPEPASAALAFFGLAGAYFGRRRLMGAA